MLKIYIVDDEKKAIDNLEYLIKQVLDVTYKIAASNNPLHAVQQIHEFQPDILFLDVQMPHLDGFAILKALGQINFKVIFITAYEQYAIQAIKNNAFDYLLKPIDGDDLIVVFNRLFSAKDKQEKNTESIKLNKEDEKISIHQMDGVHFLKVGDILRLESDGNYTKIFRTDGKSIISSKTLKIYEEVMENYAFIRVHNSHIVNYNKIASILKNEIIVMEDGSEVPLSRRRRKDLRIVMGIDK